MNKRGISWKTIILVIVFLIAVSAALYFSFWYSNECLNIECFQDAMKKCSKTQFVNEEPEASWGYIIQGKSDGDCQIKVRLLQAKKGSLGLEELNGLSMICSLPLDVFSYPQSDLTKCTGILKEKLLEIQIKKLHTYIINNLGKFDEAINSLA